jgi:demethoxyubiquinone hydroxylase (CLK1/Coq7/Cat5 family)
MVTSMDMAARRCTSLAKAKLLEILASIPYREWERRGYARMTAAYHKQLVVERAHRIAVWGREAQDNEHWHLRIIHEKMKENGQRDAWYVARPIAALVVWSYALLSGMLARLSLRRAFLLNAELEDHSEHVYADFVADHPELETQPVEPLLVRQWTDASSWADVFRRMGLDERNHRNQSFVACGRGDLVVRYAGMPEPDWEAGVGPSRSQAA